ncbi:lamin tail domain-containing protein [Candidatus Woesearchaeota archaeon]|nr:lamin tail domain-containing protein [Candidatus Woesearchaeota archaeon]
MTRNQVYEFKKLNDILCLSFNNVKYDIREMNAKLENLNTNFSNLSAESVKTAFEEQTKLIIEQQKAINKLNDRLSDLETRPSTFVKAVKTAESGLSITDLRKIAKMDKATVKQKEPSIYDIPDGEVRITKTQFKAKTKLKGNKKLNDEWVEITGYGVDLTGYKLHDKGRKHTFNFSEGFTIYGPVKIVTGKGRSTNTKIYWGSGRPVWNDSGDVATLRNNKNNIISQVSSEPTYSFKTVK